MPQSNPRTFRRIGTVIAERLSEARTWVTQYGDELHGKAGDWLVTDDKGVERTVSSNEFPKLYEALPDGTYSRTGTVTARQADITEMVKTLEGTATAAPGDWIVTAPDGSSWPVPDAVFRSGYEEVADSD